MAYQPTLSNTIKTQNFDKARSVISEMRSLISKIRTLEANIPNNYIVDQNKKKDLRDAILKVDVLVNLIADQSNGYV